MSVSDVIVSRAIDSKFLSGIESGKFSLHGSVVRLAKGQQGAGEIVGHLQIPTDANRADQALSQVKSMLSQGATNTQALQSSMNVLQGLQVANLAVSGLNLAVTTAGFVIVCKKLNAMTAILQKNSEMMEKLMDLATAAKRKSELRDQAEFLALLKTAQQFIEEDDVDQLRSLINKFNELYQFNKDLLLDAVNVPARDIPDALDAIDLLQQRLLYLGFVRASVQRQCGSYQYARAAMNDLMADWGIATNAIVDQIKAGDEWVSTFLGKSDAEAIKSVLIKRKKAIPAIEYQINMLQAIESNPGMSKQLESPVDEVRILEVRNFAKDPRPSLLTRITRKIHIRG